MLTASWKRRSMFVADRHFFVVDPARPLYNTAVYYVSIMAVNAFVTVINSAALILILYSMIGAGFPKLPPCLSPAYQNRTCMLKGAP